MLFAVMYHVPMKSSWSGYLEGERTLAEAAADLVRVVGAVRILSGYLRMATRRCRVSRTDEEAVHP